MKPELEEQEGTFRWNPAYGKEYWLGYQHGQVGGIGMTGQESVWGRYFGSVGGKHIFFRQKGERILRYVAPVRAPSVWHSDGEDEPSFPAVPAEYGGEVPDGPVKNYIKAILRKS